MPFEPIMSLPTMIVGALVLLVVMSAIGDYILYMQEKRHEKSLQDVGASHKHKQKHII